MNILHKRGKTSAVNAYAGPQGEIVINTDENTILVQDGSTPGGTVLAKYNDVNTRINRQGDRGLLAGYETPVDIDPVSTITPTSPDVLMVTGNGSAINLTFSGGMDKAFSTKIIYCFNGSSITLTGINLWLNYEVPSLSNNAVIVICFCKSNTVMGNVINTWSN